MTAMTLGRGVPAWWLRVAIGLVGAAVLVIPSLESPVLGAFLVIAPAIVVSVFAPDTPVPSAVVVGAAVLVAVTGDDPLRPVVLAMIPTVHLFHVLCGLAGVLPVRGRLHLAALRRTALRFCLVEAIVFAMVGLAALLPTTRIPAVVEGAALVGLVLVAVVILAVQRRVVPPDTSADVDDAHSQRDGRPGNRSDTMEVWGAAGRNES